MRPCLGVVLALFIAAGAPAQGVTVRGVVYDSLHFRPLGGAFVAIGTRMTTADSAGRFAIADVPPGNHRITAQHAAIDKLGISAVGAQVRVTDGRDLVLVSLPSFQTMWRQVCGPTPPATDTGFVFGTVRSSRNATVSASWIDIAATGTKISQKQKTMEVTADSLGNFTLCGVPTTTGLTIRAVADSLASGSYDLTPMDHERVARLDMTIGGQRRSTIAGKVLADSGRGPIANAQVVLTDLGASATTNERGEYVLSELPAGSHRLVVRKVGYAEIDVTVELEESERRERDVVLGRVTTLDSMQVKARWTPREEGMRVFEENRKIGLGTFLTQAQLDSANGRNLPQMLIMFPSLRITQITSGPEAGKYKAYWIGRGPKSIASKTGCDLMVFVDGVLDRSYDLNEFPPWAVAGVEYYRGGAQTPPEYSRMGSGCGVLAIHLRK
jgi:hypothetical protein